ncbi:MAG: efflux RND transporter periplasmic adaptor subunit, partial [Henriciella sp.]
AAIRGGNNFYRGNSETGQLEIVDVDVVFTDPDGAWFRSDRVEPGDLSIISPIQAAVNGMKITLLQKMSDGSVISHSRSQDRAADNSALTAGAAAQAGAIGGQ